MSLSAPGAQPLPIDGRQIRTGETYSYGSSAREAQNQASAAQQHFQSRMPQGDVYNATRNVAGRYMASAGQSYQRPRGSFSLPTSPTSYSGMGADAVWGADQVISFGPGGPRRTATGALRQPYNVPGGQTNIIHQREQAARRAGIPQENLFTPRPGEVVFLGPGAVDPVAHTERVMRNDPSAKQKVEREVMQQNFTKVLARFQFDRVESGQLMQKMLMQSFDNPNRTNAERLTFIQELQGINERTAPLVGMIVFRHFARRNTRIFPLIAGVPAANRPALFTNPTSIDTVQGLNASERVRLRTFVDGLLPIERTAYADNTDGLLRLMRVMMA